jgi:hypothetical protein
MLRVWGFKKNKKLVDIEHGKCIVAKKEVEMEDFFCECGEYDDIDEAMEAYGTPDIRMKHTIDEDDGYDEDDHYITIDDIDF